MKRLKKLTACFLVSIMSFMSAAYAEDEMPVSDENLWDNTDFAEIASADSDEWTVSEYNGTVVFNEEKTDIQLNCKTESRAISNVKALSPAVDTQNGANGVISLKFDLSATGFGTNQTAIIAVCDASNSYSAELFRLNGTTLTVFKNSDSSVTLDEETVLNIETIFDISTKQYLVKINDETTFTGTNEDISYLNKNDIHVQFQSYWTRSLIAETELNLKNLVFESDKSFAMYGFYAEEKQIGSICALDSAQEGITLRFDGIGSSVMYTKENYEVSINGEIADFEVSKSDNGALVLFSEELNAGDDVSISVIKTEDIFGNSYDDFDVNFKISTLDYIEPALEMSCDRTEFVLGETAEFEISLTGSEWTDVKLYVNDEYVNYFEQEQFTFEFTPQTAATYTIKAVVTDAYNISDKKELTVVFTPNEAPVVAFDGFTAGASKSYQLENEKNIFVTASDDTAVERIELYLNGNLMRSVSQSEYTWNLDSDGVLLGNNELTAVVYDEYGLKGEFTAYVEVTKQPMIEFLSENTFSESSGKFGSGISVTREKGLANVETIDKEHGTSLVLGIDETYAETSGNYTHVNTSKGSTYSRQEYQFDIYVDEAPENGAGLTFGVRRSTGVIQALMVVNNDQFKFGSNTVDYETGVWYNIKFFVSFENGNQYYDVYVDNVLVKSGITVDFSTSPTGYRFYTTTDASNACRIAVDNIKLSGEAKSFIIEGVSNTADEEAGETISPGTNKVCIHIDGFVVADDLNTENISLYKGKLQEKIKSIGYNEENGIIIIDTENALSSDAGYTVNFSENIRIINDITIESPMQFSFKTLPSDITINEISRKIRKQNSEISLSVSNVSETDKKIYVFATVFDEGRFVKTELFSDDVPAQSSLNSFSYNVSDSADKEIQVFVSDGINVVTIYKTIMYN